MKKNNVLSYGFGLLMGLTNLTTAQAQTPTLSPKFTKDLKKIFVTDPKKSFVTEKVQNFVDSSADMQPKNGMNIIFTNRISDHQQVVIMGDDLNNDNMLDEDEVGLMVYYAADSSKITQTSVLRVGPEDFSIARWYAANKNPKVPFDYEASNQFVDDWGVVVKKQWPRETDTLLWVFDQTKVKNKGWNFKGWTVE